MPSLNVDESLFVQEQKIGNERTPEQFTATESLRRDKDSQEDI